MKKIVIAGAVLVMSGAAQAADMTAKGPILKAPLAQVYDWTGFYVGVNAGVGMARDRTELRIGASADRSNVSPFGGVGGVQAGYNWQVNKLWLVGVEADIQSSGQRSDETCLVGCAVRSSALFDQRIDWFGTARARVGRVDGPVLGYVTGGLAYGKYSTSLTERLSPFGPAFPPLTGAFSVDESRLGYVIGSGVEVALGGNWTGKLEHLYVDLGSRSYNFVLNGVPQVLSTRVRDNVFRGGVNYRFGGPGTFAPAPAANWAGLHIGANFGTVFGRNATAMSNTVNGFADTFHLMPEGYLGGGQVGYSWQAGAWVFGVEADFQGSFAEDKDTCVSTCGTATQFSLKQTLPWFGTARGRLGYSLGSTLLYATGGFAYGETRSSLNAVPPNRSYVFTHRQGGWTVGGGIETPVNFFGLLGPNWTAKTEYLYVDLGRTNDLANPANGAAFATRTQEHVFRGGINYHFNPLTASRY